MPKLIPELKQKIIAAARHRALADEGCELTIRQVAAYCGVSVGAVYNYFPSKEALLTAVMMEKIGNRTLFWFLSWFVLKEKLHFKPYSFGL